MLVSKSQIIAVRCRPRHYRRRPSAIETGLDAQHEIAVGPPKSRALLGSAAGPAGPRRGSADRAGRSPPPVHGRPRSGAKAGAPDHFRRRLRPSSTSFMPPHECIPGACRRRLEMIPRQAGGRGSGLGLTSGECLRAIWLRQASASALAVLVTVLQRGPGTRSSSFACATTRSRASRTGFTALVIIRATGLTAKSPVRTADPTAPRP